MTITTTSTPIYRFGGWIANLSDGSTAIEHQTEPGEQTSWQQLLSRCQNENLKITGLRLVRGDITVQSMPSKMCQGYFQAYDVLRTVFRNQRLLRQGIGSVVGNQIFINWISIDGNGFPVDGVIQQEIRTLDGDLGSRIHTTLSRT